MHSAALHIKLAPLGLGSAVSTMTSPPASFAVLVPTSIASSLYHLGIHFLSLTYQIDVLHGTLWLKRCAKTAKWLKPREWPLRSRVDTTTRTPTGSAPCLTGTLQHAPYRRLFLDRLVRSAYLTFCNRKSKRAAPVALSRCQLTM